MKFIIFATICLAYASNTQRLLGALAKQRSSEGTLQTYRDILELLGQFHASLGDISLKSTENTKNLQINGNNFGTVNQTIYKVYNRKTGKRGRRRLRRDIETILRNSDGIVDNQNKRLSADAIFETIQGLIDSQEKQYETGESTVSPTTLEVTSAEVGTTDKEHNDVFPFKITPCPKCRIINGKIDCQMKFGGAVCQPHQVCSINLRSRGGKLLKLESKCKNETACLDEKLQNGSERKWGQCKPRSYKFSLCRQCCRGDCEAKLNDIESLWYKQISWNKNLLA